MSLSRRIFNVARAELTAALRRIREEGPPTLDALETALDGDAPRSQQPLSNEPPEVRRYYANLELHLGASAPEVRAAYRRLMRRYHPDHHTKDPDREKVATELTRELRVAYEGLLAYLGDEEAG